MAINNITILNNDLMNIIAIINTGPITRAENILTTILDLIS